MPARAQQVVGHENEAEADPADDRRRPARNQYRLPLDLVCRLQQVDADVRRGVQPHDDRACLGDPEQPGGHDEQQRYRVVHEHRTIAPLHPGTQRLLRQVTRRLECKRRLEHVVASHARELRWRQSVRPREPEEELAGGGEPAALPAEPTANNSTHDVYDRVKAALRERTQTVGLEVRPPLRAVQLAREPRAESLKGAEAGEAQQVGHSGRRERRPQQRQMRCGRPKEGL
eukprot:5373835-Prymnesium_polylepis.1